MHPATQRPSSWRTQLSRVKEWNYHCSNTVCSCVQHQRSSLTVHLRLQSDWSTDISAEDTKTCHVWPDLILHDCAIGAGHETTRNHYSNYSVYGIYEWWKYIHQKPIHPPNIGCYCILSLWVVCVMHVIFNQMCWTSTEVHNAPFHCVT